MSKLIAYQHKKESSKEIIHQLDKDYFEVIETHCQKAEGYAIKLKLASLSVTHKAMSDIYVNMCLGVIEDIKTSIRLRREKILPYLEDLSKKIAAGHDCNNCSNGCAIKHADKIPEISVAHNNTKELFGILERVAVPMYENNDTELYKLLRNEMVIIQTATIEMLYLEESILIPQILKEQKAIASV